jgi:hypothetical protein
MAAPTSAVLSNIITGLDATPIIRPGVGQVSSLLQRYLATITPAATQAASVLSRLVRVPSNAIIERVAVAFDAVSTTTFTGNIGLWYSDNSNDGTSLLNAGNLTAISSTFFASAVAMGALVVPTDETFAASAVNATDGNYLPSQSFLPIWQAVANSLALQTTPTGAFTNVGQAAHFNTPSVGGVNYVRSDDPGGFFDICVQLTTAGVGAAFKFNMFVDVAAPGA